MQWEVFVYANGARSCTIDSLAIGRPCWLDRSKGRHLMKRSTLHVWSSDMVTPPLFLHLVQCLEGRQMAFYMLRIF